MNLEEAVGLTRGVIKPEGIVYKELVPVLENLPPADIPAFMREYEALYRAACVGEDVRLSDDSIYPRFIQGGEDSHEQRIRYLAIEGLAYLAHSMESEIRGRWFNAVPEFQLFEGRFM